ncbi:hypothetical protein D3C85_1001360 [compost metagenome]
MVSKATPCTAMGVEALARTFMSYLACWPTLGLAGSSSSGLSAWSTASRSSCWGTPI